ncbi:Ribose transport system permease protein RbsC [Oceanibacterium hippocampi]|uniref:Autoinducer 2 import system permease protein LsrD n=2 Tax=Oceanibacterium hippocampi TaxID=745714 RepID=A0A1Y5TZG9_9PROT|nr:Ribose transport system permease protein RbsC [Oceanibacterium hippocampi]
MFVAVVLLGGISLSYFQVSSAASGMAPLALAAMGETVVIIVRGFDLSAGAIVSLSNVIVASQAGDSPGNQMLWSCLAVLAAGGVGAVNGYLIAYRRLQPIVVTLATMFMVSGINLMILPFPGGNVPIGTSNFFAGDLVEGVVPAAAVHVVVALLIWAVVKKTRFGTALYSVGGNEEAATARGIRAARTKFFSYVLAGLFYGYGGLLLSANTGSGDPLGGNALLLSIFAAVVIGGTRLGGGRGGCLGTVLAAFILMQISSLMLVLSVSTNIAPLFQGVIVLVAIAIASLLSGSPAMATLSGVRATLAGAFGARRSFRMERKIRVQEALKLPDNDELAGGPIRRFLLQYGDKMKMIVPVYVLLACVIIASALLLGSTVLTVNYFNSLMLLTLITALLALGQGIVVISGGMDLSVGQAVTLCGVLAAGFYGQFGHIEGMVPLIFVVVLAVGALIGVLNAIGVVFLGIPAVIMTIGANGVLSGFTLLYTNGVPSGTVPESLRWLFGRGWYGFAPAIMILFALLAIGWFLVSRTRFGWRVLSVGSNPVVAGLSGVPVARTITLAFVVSGLCSASAGLLLIGYTGSAVLNMGEAYLLPALAAVFMGGTLATGGRGHYLGIFGGAFLLTAIGMLVTGADLSHAVRQIVLGAVVLAAILFLNESES